MFNVHRYAVACLLISIIQTVISEMKCVLPPNVPNASYTLRIDYEIHSRVSIYIATYTCDRGYQFENSTNDVSKCTFVSAYPISGNYWTGTISRCIDITCGVLPGKKIGHGKIVGGRLATDPWPWMAALFFVSQGLPPEYFCGGSIVHERFILTAAHCLYRNDRTKIDKTEILVKLGLIDVRNQSSLQESEVEKILMHPNYRSGPRFDYDIALLQLKTPIKFNSLIRPICLPPRELPLDTSFYKPGEYVVAIGWGHVRVVRIMELVEYQPPERLKEIVLPIQSPERCRSREGLLALLPKNAFSDRMFCAGDGRGGNDTCQGDSGGPVMQSSLNGDGETYWIQVGIISWGIGCGLANTFGYYTHVQKLMDWVTSNIPFKN